MSLAGVEALTFDTGGTVLDWHSGFSRALAALGKKHGVSGDWAEAARELRRKSLALVVNQGADAPPAHSFDDAHRIALDEVLASSGLDAATPEERRGVWWDAAHGLACWPDFPSVLPRLRERYVCVSFTLLSVRLIIDTGRRNGLSWDAVLSCETMGKYKVLPEAYETAARWLRLPPSACCMVACHAFDLDAAKRTGFRTALVRRPDEWGGAGGPSPASGEDYDIAVDDFPGLARALGVPVPGAGG